MNLDAATGRVKIWIADQCGWKNDLPQIVDARTQEHDFGWVFFFRLPHRPFPERFDDITGAEFPPVAINRHDGSITRWRSG